MDINILILVLSVVTVGVLFYGIEKLKKATPNVDYTQYLENSKQLLDVVQNLTKSFNVGTPEQQQTVDNIIRYSKLGVDYAEQLYKSGQLPSEDRKAKAVEFVQNAIKEAGVELTEQQISFTQAVIESMVFMLPKTTVQVTAQALPANKNKRR